MRSYRDLKEAARMEAIEWQRDFDKQIYSWSDLAWWCDHFTRIGKKYGLLSEFRENGIC